YIRLKAFRETTPAEVKKILTDLQASGMKGLILDLRFNPGGALGGYRQVADLFVGEDTLYLQRDRAGETKAIKGTKGAKFRNFPIGCLVNGESAAGSEIVAACLQDNKRAVIMGERTPGSASIQNLLDFDGGVVKYTQSTFLGPNGRNLDRANAGNKPDEWGV